MLHDEDTTDLPYKDKDACIETRWRRLLRICDEACEQVALVKGQQVLMGIFLRSVDLRRRVW